MPIMGKNTAVHYRRTLGHRMDRYIAVGDFYLMVGMTVLFVEYL